MFDCVVPSDREREEDGDVVFTMGKFEGQRVSEVETWYLRFVVKSGYLFPTKQWRASLNELRRREKAGE